jgi:acyl-CoA synthetase (AMP-forming)/AMP-acid ligase II
MREDGTDADYDEPGELWMTGETIVLGYWGNPKATAETFFEDEQGRRWLKTGDRFKVDKAGFLFFEDRIKVRPCFPQSPFTRHNSLSRTPLKLMACKSHLQKSKSPC